MTATTIRKTPKIAGEKHLAEPMHQQRADPGANEAARRQHDRRAEVDVRGSAEEDRADQRDRHDRRQRRRLRAVLAEPGHHQRRDHHDAAADPEEAAQHACPGTDRREQSRRNS